MDNLVYIIYKNEFPYEIIRGDYQYVLSRLDNWREFDKESKWELSDIGYPLLDQYEY